MSPTWGGNDKTLVRFSFEAAPPAAKKEKAQVGNRRGPVTVIDNFGKNHFLPFVFWHVNGYHTGCNSEA